MWVDNFFRPRYIYNPSLMANARLNCTVMAVLHVLALRPAFAPPSFCAWGTIKEGVLNSLVTHWDRLLATVEKMNASRAAEQLQGQVRVPLDIHRTGVRSLQWTSCCLSPTVIST